MRIRGVTPPKYGRHSIGIEHRSIKDKLHPNGHIIGGNHDNGLKHRAKGQIAGLDYFHKQIAEGNIKLERRNRKIRYKILQSPSIAWGCVDELALRRAQHFIENEQHKWMNEAEFEKAFRSIYDNYVNAFKN